jgi:hypothetical protein
MLKYQTHSCFGSLYYYEIVQQMTSVDSKAVRTITRELTQLKVTDQESQCIAKVVKLIRATIIWLDMVNMKPPDIDYIVYYIMLTCTVPDFILFLKTLETTASLNKVRLNANDILNKCKEQYCIPSIMKRWDVVNHCGSAFLLRIPPQARQVRNCQRIPPPTWACTPPTQEENHERTHKGKLYKWCSTCNPWFYGSRAHLTVEHTAGYQSSRHNNDSVSNLASASNNHSDTSGLTQSVYLSNIHLHSSGSNQNPESSSPFNRTYFSAGM